MSKEELVELWERIMREVKLPVQVGTLVEGVEADEDGMWRLITSTGPVRAANVFLGLVHEKVDAAAARLPSFAPNDV